MQALRQRLDSNALASSSGAASMATWHLGRSQRCASSSCSWSSAHAAALHALGRGARPAGEARPRQWLVAAAAADGPRSISSVSTTPADAAPAPPPPSAAARSPEPAAGQLAGEEQDGIAALLSREGDEPSPDVKGASPLLALGSLLGVGFLLGGGYLLKDQIKAFLEFFITAVDQWGVWGVGAYAAVYIALEVLALPAIPLTMTAGVIFGTTQGTIITSLSATVAATIAFLIARYLARDRVRQFASKHPKWRAIDRAIGKNGLKFVTLLRLSPLLPLAASNWLYGCTSVDVGSYVLGSFVGMLPGTWAYVHAGALGRQVLMEGEGQLTVESWQVGLGLASTLLALAFVGRLAKTAIEEAEAEQQPAVVDTTGSAVAAAAAAGANGDGAKRDADGTQKKQA